MSVEVLLMKALIFDAEAEAEVKNCFFFYFYHHMHLHLFTARWHGQELFLLISIYMDAQDHAIYHVWIHFVPSSLYPRREENILSEPISNPGPLASQATALTTRPWLLGQSQERFLE